MFFPPPSPGATDTVTINVASLQDATISTRKRRKYPPPMLNYLIIQSDSRSRLFGAG